MAKRGRLRELYDKADNIKPLAEKDGQMWVTFEDAAVLNSINAEEPRGTGLQTRNPDGSLASIGKTVHAINPDYFFLNRYRVKNKKLYVVSGHTPAGYRCIREQTKGRTFIKNIPCYVFAREKAEGDEKGEIALEKVITVSESEFVSDFTNTLDHKSMAELLPLITEYGNEMTADSMPI